jgi:cysteine desulfurase
MRASSTIYLDYNATSPPSPGVVDAVRRSMEECWGNPSSPHVAGRRARALLSDARDAVAALANCDPDRLLFTSGATESCNHILRAARRPGQPLPVIVASTIEHAAVLAAAEREAAAGRSVTTIGVDRQGVVDLASLEDVVGDGGALVSVQWVNNEIGTVQPIAEIASICDRHGAMLHVDACQAFGKLEIDLDLLPADFVSISGHKIGAPPGVGALYVRDRRLLPSLQVGGEQERSRRAGTENLPGIAGFGAAAAERRLALHALVERWTLLRASFESGLPQGARVNAVGAPRIANTSSVVFPGTDGAALIARLDARGICVSQGSACHSARPEPSHVLRAIGLSESDAYATLRFSLGAATTLEEITSVLEALRLEVGTKSTCGGAAVA